MFVQGRAAIVLACVVLFGDRIPLDAGAQYEYRARLCAATLEFQERSYERVLAGTGYEFHGPRGGQPYPEPQEAWWSTIKEVPLHITIQEQQ